MVTYMNIRPHPNYRAGGATDNFRVLHANSMFGKYRQGDAGSTSLKTDLRFARPKIRGSTERAKRRSDENVVKMLWNPTAWWSE
jgi:hypothetical protein